MAVSQTEAPQVVLICQALLIYDIHVGVVELQLVRVERQLFWYICDAIPKTRDSTTYVAFAAAKTHIITGEVWKCEQNDVQPQGACKVEMRTYITILLHSIFEGCLSVFLNSDVCCHFTFLNGGVGFGSVSI